ncbi:MULTISPECIES: type II toxin-antitoxin system RelE/ParE family toxin [Roseivirga]|uniref:type II toxin-antitoxin system RelE/ParE family toxin n=1 Tax=Roseivirga TaxID=290180 RepID=UPI00257E8346|nr:MULTISPECIES: type II toxin-antitoxin system RelE/ParE family toxin [Roseivirga]MEC7754281.1 type II toxin-antitoxin system RelE/ParE family toxin [Bacteroidota bacterium]|tara:strand:+ start:835 stop:1134 length:300 start_codon:yes stop_codon:yes gene_type:complete
MVKRVIWSPRAQTERKEILDFWFKRNKSKTYSRKLNRLFKEAINLIIDYPEIGKRTDLENVRAKIIRDYIMFYEINDDELFILSIWDTRQNPENLKLKI